MSIIAYRNAADTAVVSTPNTTLSGYPVTNVQVRDSGRVTRADAINFDIHFDFGSAFLPRFVGIFGTSRPGTGAGVILYYSDNGSTWNSAGTHAEATTSDPTLPFDAKLLVNPATSAHRYWRVRQVQINRPAGYQQIGRIWMSGADDLVEIPDGLNADWTTRVDDRSSVDETESGIVYEDQRARIRSVSCTLSAQPTSRAFGVDQAGAITTGSSLQKMQLTLGNTGEAVFLPRVQPAWRHLIGFRGRLASGMAIRHEAGGHYSASFEAIEER